MSRYHASPEQLEHFRETLTHHLANYPGLLFALFYGSAAEGNTFQDLDVGIFVERKIVPASRDIEYAALIAEEVQRYLPVPVEVQVINEAPLLFRYNVSRGTALVVNDREAFVTFLERTWRDALDFQPVAMHYLRELLSTTTR